MRQVSFTLLLTGRCDSNPAQYERNRRFGHLVHVLIRSNDGAKLPSVGIRLNASKAETRLDMATLLLDRRTVRGTLGLGLRPGVRSLSCARNALDFPTHPILGVPVPNRL